MSPMDAPVLPWESYNLDALKTAARARLAAQGDDPHDSLKLYAMVTQLRGEELRRRLPVVEGRVVSGAEGETLVPVERRLPAVPEARSAKDTV